MNGLVDSGRQLQSRRLGRQLLAESLLNPFGVRARLPAQRGFASVDGQRRVGDRKQGRAAPAPKGARRAAVRVLV